MPKFHQLEVNGGDRESLLRFALTARLVDSPGTDSTKRGSPKLPEPLLGELGFSSQRHFTQYLYRGSLLTPNVGPIVDTVDRLTPGLRPLDDLRRGLIAVHNPSEVVAGVSEQFWPTLRTIPISRHPVDAIISACAAANYLERRVANARDIRGIERLQRSLCRIAVGGYAHSSRAVDLIAVLSRWDISRPVSEVRGGRRRLARALDRTLRTYVRRSSWPSADLASGGASREFAHLFGEVAKNMDAMMHAPHTPTSSSSPVLRLGRVLVRYHDPSNDSERAAAVGVAKRLSILCCEPTASAGTDDILLRREALLYLLEMRPMIERADAFPVDLPAILERVRQGGDEFGDLLALADNDELLRAPMNPEAAGQELLRSDQTGTDVVTNVLLSAQTWPIHATQYASTLLQHLPTGEQSLTAPWRELTKQVAIPTRDLLFEILTSPASGRVRTIADTLRHAGPGVQDAVTAALVRMLRDADVMHYPTLARRALWTIGFAGSYSSDAATTLAALAYDRDIDYSISADAAWALGDMLPTFGGSAAGNAVATLKAIVESTTVDLEQRPHDARKRLIRTQAALHALAVQRRGQHASTFAAFIDKARDVVLPEHAIVHLKRARFLAHWGMDLIDSPPALALAQAD